MSPTVSGNILKACHNYSCLAEPAVCVWLLEADRRGTGAVGGTRSVLQILSLIEKLGDLNDIALPHTKVVFLDSHWGSTRVISKISGSWSDFKAVRLNFCMKNILEVGRGKKTYRRRYRTKAFLKGRKPGLFVNFGNLHSLGSGSRTAK